MFNIIITAEFALLVFALSTLSGVGSYLQGYREKRLTRGFHDLITEIITAIVVGLAVAYAGYSFDMDEGYLCAAILIFSNNGSESLVWIKQLFRERLSKIFNTK
jgi:hypothetical protein